MWAEEKNRKVALKSYFEGSSPDFFASRTMDLHFQAPLFYPLL